MTGDDYDDTGDGGRPDPRKPRRSCRPLWLGGLPEGARGLGRDHDGTGVHGGGGGCGSNGDGLPGHSGWAHAPGCLDPECPDPECPDPECHDHAGCASSAHDPATCDECAPGFDALDGVLDADAPEPDLGEIVVILLVSTLTGLRDRLERDGFGSAAALVHDLVEVADDYVMRFQP